MSKNLKSTLERAETWPTWAQEELIEVAREIDRELQAGTYHATREELEKLDDALAAVQRGEVATLDEVEAVFLKNRRA